MFGTGPAPDAPQFQTAEYAGQTNTSLCKYCGLSIGGAYYRVNQQIACGSCAEKARLEGPLQSHAAFVRAIVFGIGAAILGMIIYATFTIATGLMVGYVSLLVGFMVGKAMMMGSGGVGGKRYQIAAALLTYIAVSVAAIPIYIHYAREHHPTQVRRGAPGSTASAPANPSASPDASSSATSSTAAASPSGAAPQPHNLVAMFGTLFLLGLASPFLELASPVPGLIGLLILFVGIRIAWQTAKGHPGIQIAGPF
jgi:hypothetical protein